MHNKFRREAAILAVYLSQFGSADIPSRHENEAASHSIYCEAHYRRDYLQVIHWITTTYVTGDDVSALMTMRRAYGFRSEM